MGDNIADTQLLLLYIGILLLYSTSTAGVSVGFVHKGASTQTLRYRYSVM